MYQQTGFHEVSDPLEGRPQGSHEHSRRPFFGFFLASSSVEPRISMCAYQLWLVTRNAHTHLTAYMC